MTRPPEVVPVMRPKVGVFRMVPGNAKGVLIENVEEFSAKLSQDSFMNWNVPKQRHVPVRQGRPEHGVVAEVPQPIYGRHCKGPSVEIVRSRIDAAVLDIGAPVDSSVLIARDVRALVVATARSCADIGVVAGCIDLKRRPRL